LFAVTTRSKAKENKEKAKQELVQKRQRKLADRGGLFSVRNLVAAVDASTPERFILSIKDILATDGAQGDVSSDKMMKVLEHFCLDEAFLFDLVVLAVRHNLMIVLESVFCYAKRLCMLGDLMTARDRWGRTLLIFIMQERHDYVLDQFLTIIEKEGVMVEVLKAQDRKGNTPMHWAIELNDPNGLYALLQAAKKTNAYDEIIRIRNNIGGRALRFAQLRWWCLIDDALEWRLVRGLLYHYW